jgi:cytochrome c6
MRFVTRSLLCALAFGFGIFAAGDPPTPFLKNCAPCHGRKGGADTPVAKTLGVKRLDSPEVQKKKDEEILTQIAKGKGKMPSFAGKIPEADLKVILEYVRSLAKKP